MTRRKKTFKRSGKIASALIFVTFLPHFAWTLYSSKVDFFNCIEYLNFKLTNAYSYIGFEWSGLGAYIVSASLVSAFIVNGVRRLIEGTFYGWPQFSEHDKSSLKISVVSLVGYGLLMYFSVGFFGEEQSQRHPNLIDIFLVSATTYIVGMLVDMADDVISGFFCVYIGGRK